MAFALTGFKADGIQWNGPNRTQCYQVACLRITATAADVDLDISDFSGTFWTAALANPTYGGLADLAQDKLEVIQDQAAQLLSVETEALMDRIQVSTPPGANQYNLAISSHLPDITCSAADGETAWDITLTWRNLEGKPSINVDLGDAET